MKIIPLGYQSIQYLNKNLPLPSFLSRKIIIISSVIFSLLAICFTKLYYNRIKVSTKPLIPNSNDSSKSSPSIKSNNKNTTDEKIFPFIEKKIVPTKKSWGMTDECFIKLKYKNKTLFLFFNHKSNHNQTLRYIVHDLPTWNENCGCNFFYPETKKIGLYLDEKKDGNIQFISAQMWCSDVIFYQYCAHEHLPNNVKKFPQYNHLFPTEIYGNDYLFSELDENKQSLVISITDEQGKLKKQIKVNDIPDANSTEFYSFDPQTNGLMIIQNYEDNFKLFILKSTSKMEVSFKDFENCTFSYNNVEGNLISDPCRYDLQCPRDYWILDRINFCFHFFSRYRNFLIIPCPPEIINFFKNDLTPLGSSDKIISIQNNIIFLKQIDNSNFYELICYQINEETLTSDRSAELKRLWVKKIDSPKGSHHLCCSEHSLSTFKIMNHSETQIRDVLTGDIIKS